MTERRMAILVGGGPAPGINGVISAATIEAVHRGYRVFGITDGFTKLAAGDQSCFRELTISNVSQIDSLGGSILGVSKTDPTRDPQLLANVLKAFKDFGITHLITIGGDGTASVALVLAKHAQEHLAFGHVPKTIDNDLPLPGNSPTFGYETAREMGARVVKALLTDAQTTSRWHLVVTMGRDTGHLALGIGIAARTTLSIIPEEFPGQISVSLLTDIISGSVIKRLAQGRRYGVVVLAEGVVQKLHDDLRSIVKDIERDPHGNLRLSDIDLGGILSQAVTQRLKSLGVSMVVLPQEVGYELRCASPVAFDREYTLELGYGVVDLLDRGHSEVMVVRQGNELLPMPFSEVKDSESGQAKLRYVDLQSLCYKIACKYMIRLTKEDLEMPETLAQLSAKTNLSPADFAKEFRAAASPITT